MSKCSQPQCPVARTGTCLEGHKKDCPHLIPDDPASPNEAFVENPPAPLLEKYRFSSGEKLILTEASRLLSGAPVRVILCAGAHRSGKTTLIALIGEMFRHGQFKQYDFSGSETLCAFERASWRATFSSGAGIPDTRRTDRVENDTFFHLIVKPVDKTSGPIELLVSDLAGETYPEAVASLPFCQSLQALARADHLVLFIDSNSMIDNAKRHAECDNARTFLNRVLAVKHRPKALHVHVIFSRWDYVARHANREAVEGTCNDLEKDLRQRFGSSFASLSFLKIAARPEQISPTRDGVQLLFGRWVETPTYVPVESNHRDTSPKRDFSRYGLYD